MPPLPNYVFSVNNRYLGLGSPLTVGSPLEGEATISYGEMSNANAANVWFKFKDFMTTQAGWTVVKSGVAWTATDQLNVTGDLFITDKLMNLSMMYFVLQDPLSKRQLMFYRSPDATTLTTVNDPFTKDTKAFYSYIQKALGSFATNPTITPIYGQQVLENGTTYTGVTTVDASGVVTISNVLVNGTPTNFLSPNMVGQYIALVPPTDTLTPGAFYTTTAQITAIIDDTTLQISDPSGQTFNASPAMGFYITGTGAMIGTKAHIDTATRITTVSGLVNMTPASIGHTLKLSTMGGSGPNDGEYLIIDYVDENTVKIINKDGQVFSITDPNNGQLLWKECFQAIDYVAVQQDRMSIAYSADSKFTSMQMISGTQSGSTWYVPYAVDMVWISPQEQSLPPYTYPAQGVGNFFAHSNTKKIQQSTYWNLHMCASTVAPFQFYFWLTYQETDVTSYLTAEKQRTDNPGSATNSNITISNTVPYIYDSLSFFALDSIADNPIEDVDPVVFWCDVAGGAPAHKSGHYPATMSNINELLPVGSVAPSTTYCIRSWYKKPAHFADSTDFMNRFTGMTCGFLPTAVLMYQIVQSYEYGSSKGIVTIIPGNLSTNTYSSFDEIFPLMYGRGSVQYQNQINYNPQQNALVKEPFKLPPSYKGVSTMLHISGNQRNQFDLLNEDGDAKKYIYAGRSAHVVLPWDGLSNPNMM